MIYFNSLFIYFLFGWLLYFVVTKLVKSRLDVNFRLLTAFGLAPFALSIVLLYLYLLFPSKHYSFYSNLIYISSFLLGVWSIDKEEVYKLKNYFRKIIFKVRNFKYLKSISGVLLIYIALVTGFIFIRGFTFPANSGDTIKYLQQGSRIADKRTMLGYFSSRGYLVDSEVPNYGSSIRPGLPVLYSFFYDQSTGFETSEFLARFVYFYYFILLLALVYCVTFKVTGRHDQSVFGLTLLVSTFSFIRFLIRPNYKEIVLVFVTILWLYFMERFDIKKSDQRRLFFLLTSILFGWMMFINYSGLILIAILFTIFVFREKGKLITKIRFSALSLPFIFLSSGGELVRAIKFVTRPSEINFQNRIHIFSKAVEVENYKIVNGQLCVSGACDVWWRVLIRSKLEAFTQPYLHGTIFWIFIVLLLYLLIKKGWKSRIHSWNALLFMGLFFFIIKDPLFLNPHKFAYVLAISEKYTAFLVPFAAIFIATNYEPILRMLKRLIAMKKFHLLLFTVSVPLLFVWVRSYLSRLFFNLASNIIRLYNVKEYYLLKIDHLLLLVACLLIFFAITFVIIDNFENNLRIKYANLFFLVLILILPFVFSLNSNFSLSKTIRNTFSSRENKLVVLAHTEQERNIYKVIGYLKQNSSSWDTFFVAVDRFQIQIEYNLGPLRTVTEYTPGNKYPVGDNYNYVVSQKSFADKVVNGKIYEPRVSYGKYIIYAKK